MIDVFIRRVNSITQSANILLRSAPASISMGGHLRIRLLQQG
jgi:hypothetical protein